MCRKKITSPDEKVNISSRKRGFTIVELTIALALLAIFTTMVVSFSVLMKESAKDSSSEYGFMQDAFVVKEKFTKWAAEQDVDGASFVVDNDKGILTVADKKVEIVDGALILGDVKVNGVGEYDSFKFEADETKSLIKCTITRTKENGQELESHFVFSLRCAEVEVANGN